MSSSVDINSTLSAHGMIIGRDTTSSANSSNTVLAARTTDGCTNPNCKAKKQSTHTTANCYWPGDGKEGQFSPNFGQKNQANLTISTSNTSQPEHFVLPACTIDIPGDSGIIIDIPDDNSPMALISKGFQKFQKRKNTYFYGFWSKQYNVCVQGCIYQIQVDQALYRRLCQSQ